MRRRAVWIAGRSSAALLTSAAPVRAATLDVTKAADTADGACNGDCSLREAVIAANNTPGADTITLHAQTYVLSLAIRARATRTRTSPSSGISTSPTTSRSRGPARANRLWTLARSIASSTSPPAAARR